MKRMWFYFLSKLSYCVLPHGKEYHMVIRSKVGRTAAITFYWNEGSQFYGIAPSKRTDVVVYNTSWCLDNTFTDQVLDSCNFIGFDSKLMKKLLSEAVL